MKCLDCKFAGVTEERYGGDYHPKVTCRFNAAKGKNDGLFYTWPMVLPEDWCGQYSARETAAKCIGCHYVNPDFPAEFVRIPGCPVHDGGGEHGN